MINAQEAKAITNTKRILLQKENEESISRFLDRVSNAIRDAAERGKYSLFIKIGDGLCCFYTPLEVKTILMNRFEQCGFTIDDKDTAKSVHSFWVRWG